ncbi:MAG: glutamate-5-semialdehyde dehydrogenase [Rhodothermales bacterium]|jgi:glutamate-5-semialdehyde dehydrogenase
MMLPDIQRMGREASDASVLLARTSSDARARAVRALADALHGARAEILEANERDVAAAIVKGTSAALIDRLRLDAGRLERLIGDTRAVADLPDPVGETMEERTLPSGLRLSRRRVPLGVIGVIYEARPNVTMDISALCVRSGNASILRGGSETLESNRALVRAIHAGLRAVSFPEAAVQFIDSRERRYTTELVQLDEYVDMIIPRGGAGLHRMCVEKGTVPVITGGIGICHVYVEATADLESALAIIENAKVQRPSVCNALDTVLVDKSISAELLPALARRLLPLGVDLRATAEALEAIGQGAPGPPGQDTPGRVGRVTLAGPDDFDHEWLSLVLGIRVVDGIDAALAHIRAHGSGHSDAIVTTSKINADRFVMEVDSAAVYVNASTRFTDGGEFGLGAEVAVSTQKLHARGPMGLEALTTYKWIGIGDGLVRS